jgi:hypothetical protein
MVGNPRRNGTNRGIAGKRSPTVRVDATEGDFPMATTLDSFALARLSDGYLLQLEDEEGTVTEFAVNYDQLELMTEEIERQLDQDEEEALIVDS